jgi:hypothetical protein
MTLPAAQAIATAIAPRYRVTNAALTPASADAQRLDPSMRIVKQRPRLREVVVQQRRHMIVGPFEAFQYIDDTAPLHDAAANRRTLTNPPCRERITSAAGARIHHQMRAQRG